MSDIQNHSILSEKISTLSQIHEQVFNILKPKGFSLTFYQASIVAHTKTKEVKIHFGSTHSTLTLDISSKVRTRTGIKVKSERILSTSVRDTLRSLQEISNE